MRDQEVARRIAARLTLLAESRGLSQRALARRAGLPPEVVSRAVRGHHTPSIATLERLCGGLEVSLASFFTQELPSAREGSPSVRPGPAAELARLVDDLPPRSQALVLKGVESIVRGLRTAAKARSTR